MSDTPSSPAPPDRLRRDCRRLAAVLPATCLILLALVVLEALGPWLVRRPDAGQITAGLTGLVAPAAYIAALWRLGMVLKIFGISGRFVTGAGSVLRSVGWALAAGGGFQVLLAPALEKFAGRDPGYWIGLNPAAVALAALGLALVTFARLFRRAARLEAELETIL